MSLLKSVSLAAFLLGAFSLPASAIERVNTNKLSCVKVQTKLIQNGAAILRYPSKRNPSLTLYDRYVGDSRYCPLDEIGKWTSVPAKDTRSCRVIACEKYQPSDLFPFKHRSGVYLRIIISN
jgi:hypothetical protein